ncbi:MAG TPA: prepilin-type N-terminal cleavage/methylation domain-containing protein [bacterium]|nr:prepilin-type N-terminal cleavage/methylation domain-containing protein [bacterium]HOL95199.1 prepilin-type N-terminal cleavage/methylation domain-containing protein [bacterium]HPP01621.1 prepilin-type N-terminal cleavage/methylation domain-containing protein [bacterium]HXK95835.1 prepilin-type N-terminal cleavage/methylation domain-containing protein [bacterium]
MGIGQSSSFTLIELLIVVAIIGILAAIAVPNFLNAQTRAKIARVMGDFKAYGTALETYILDQNAAPWDMPCPSGDHGWASCLSRLTTPVAYINAVMPDVFQAEDVRANLSPSHFVGSLLSYDYTTIYFNGGVGTQSAIWKYLFGNSLWRLASAGPDRALINVTARQWLAPPYNPSNGLVSPGDITYSQQSFLDR